MNALTPASREGRRRVVVFINDMRAAGGIQRVAANLVRDLRPDFETMLLTVEPLESPVFHEPGLAFHSLNRPARFRGLLGKWLHMAATGRALRRWVEEHRIDTVLAIWYDWASVAALFLPRRVQTIGCEHISFFEIAWDMRLLRSVCYRYLDGVVSLTQEDLPYLARICPRAVVIPNYVRQIEPGPEDAREQTLLTVGHIDSRKGIDRLLWALQGPLLANPDWTLVVLGGGERGHTDWDYLEYLAELLRALRLEGQVQFHPATPRIDDWYRRAAIYVMGSRREGLPMVLIEAKAHGLPVIAFDCPTGPKEIVHDGKDGFLIDNTNPAFAAAAQRLMVDPALRRQMGDAARADIHRRFSPESVLAQWRALIDRVPALTPR